MAETYISFKKEATKIQKQINKKMDSLDKYLYTVSDLKSILEMLNRTSKIILQQKYSEYDNYVEVYLSEFKHFPNKNRSIIFIDN